MKPLRKIKILLDQRAANDSSIFLENIANCFPQHDIIIKVNYDTQIAEYEIRNDIELENEVIDTTSRALNEVENKSKIEKKETEEFLMKSKGKFKKYIEKLSLEGIRVSVTAIIKSAIGLLFR